MADNNEGVIIRVGLDGVNVTQSLNSLRNTVRSSMNQMRAEMSVFDQAGNRVGRLNTQFLGLQRTIAAQDIQIQALTRNYNEARTQFGETSQEARRYQNQINNVARVQAGLRTQLSEVTTELATARREMSLMGRTSSAFNTISQQAENASKKLHDFGKSMTMSLTLPVGGVLTAGAKSYLQFNQELTTMKSLLNDGTVNAAQLNQEISQLGNNTQNWAQLYGESTSAVNNGETELIKKGYTFNQVIGAMPTLLEAARATGDDFSTVMNIASSTLEQFNLKAKDTATMTANTKRVTDDLSFVANKTAAGFDDMGTAMEYVGPVAHSVGYSLEDTAAAIGLLSNNGILADKAGTALRGSISRMLKPTKQSAAAFEEMGLSTDKMKKGFYTLPDLIDTINKNTQGMTKAEKAHLITQGFGVEAQTGMNVLLSQGADKLRALSKEEQTATGYTKKLSDQMGNTAQLQVNRLKSSFQVLGQQVGKELIPELIPLVDETTKLIKEFGNLSDAQKHNIVNIALFTAGLGPATLLISGMLKPVSLLYKGLGLATRAMSGFGAAATVEAAGGAAAAAGEAGALTGALGLLANPVGLTIAGLGALGVAGYAVYKGIKNTNSAMADIKPVSLDAANAMMKQYDSNNKMIDSLDKLRQSCKLTDGQFSRLVDLNHDIETSTNPKAIADYKKEFEDLQKKSGLSNKQLQTMLDLNSSIVTKIPEATGAITTQGNRIADTTGALKGYNAEMGKATMHKLQGDLETALGNQKKTQENINILQSQYQDGLKKEQGLKNKIDSYDQSAVDKEKAKYQAVLKSGNANDAQLAQASRMLGILDQGVGYYQAQLGAQIKQDDATQSQIDKLKNQKKQIDVIIGKMDALVFAQNGLTYKQGEGVGYIDKQISGLQKQKDKLEEAATPNQRNTQEFRDQVGHINDQISKLQGVKSQLEGIDKIAGKPVTKKVTITVDTSHMSYKEKSIVMGQLRAYNVQANPIKGYAVGTNYAPGGYAIVGEQGPELMYVPKGAQIKTTDQTMKMINNLTTQSKSIQMMNRAINSIPSGKSSSAGVNNNKLEQLQAQNNQLVAILIQTLSDKQFSISAKDIYNANKNYSNQQQQKVNMAKGVLTSG